VARKGKPKAPKPPKRIPYTFLPPEEPDGSVPEPYRQTGQLTAAHHAHLVEARICVVWARGWKPDKDEERVLGKAKKASDFDRELRDWDFVILLNEVAWTHLEPLQRRALVDHELCHCAAALDPETGDQLEDERCRPVWRIRKHDLEEFREVVERNGLYKDDLARFASACAAKVKHLPPR